MIRKRGNNLIISSDETDVDKISSEETDVRIPKDTDIANIEEIWVTGCSYAFSVDLGLLNRSPTLRIIRVVWNRPFERLILPKGCPNLEEVIITNNQHREETFPRTVMEMRYWRRKLGISESIEPEPVQPPPIDLSILDGSPRLRIFKVANNGFSHSGIILPSHCSNLEAVIINETRVIEWRLENCPNLKLVRIVILNKNYGTLDVMPLFTQFQSSTALPLVSITIKTDWGIDLIDNFKGLPKELRKRMAVLISPGYRQDICFPPYRTGMSGIWNEERKLCSYYGIYTIPEIPFREDAWNDYHDRY